MAAAVAFTDLGGLAGAGSPELGGLEEELLYLNFENIVGKSAALRKVLDQVAIVAPTGATVLLCGETGTGRNCSPGPFTTSVRAGSGRLCG